MWNGRDKRSADDHFLEDGYTRCDEIWWALGCDDVAYGMYLVVGRSPRTTSVGPGSSAGDEVMIWRLGWVGAVALGSAPVLGWAFGADSLCTTEYSCTTVACPDSCARINRVAWAEVGILVVCGAIGVCATRWRRLNVVVAVVAALSLAISLVLTSRW